MLANCGTCCCRTEYEVEGLDGNAKAYERAGLVEVEKDCATISPRPVFVVELQKTSADELGMDVEEVDGKSLRVTSVKDTGMVAEWNSGTSSDIHVEAGQSIIEINGVKGDSDALLKLLLAPLSMRDFVGEANKRLKLTISRNQEDTNKTEEERVLPPKVFVVVVEKAAGTLIGLDVDGSDATSLRIARVKEGGIVQKWNEDHPDEKLQVGDWITGVNGHRGKDALLQQFCKVGKFNGQLRLEIRRNPEAVGPSVDL
mmetsp:Transcript_112954/g.205304  ORF Transcript_112954/g.205304 Transcript_112954/m.205304 type:complete len:257 (+) Transcript_112954:126-896(+)